MYRRTFHKLSGWFMNFGRRIFFKLILFIVIPNLLLTAIIHELISKQIQTKIEETNNNLFILEHAASREIRALFNDVMTLTNQILIEPEVQRILTGSRSAFSKDDEARNASEPISPQDVLLREKYLNQEIMRSILSRYRLVWNNIFSIAVIDTKRQVYLNTSDNYRIDPADLENSKLLEEVGDPDTTGICWSVNDALTKNTDMITIARKIYGVNQPQNVVGYVVVNLSLDAVRESFATYNYYDQMIFGLMNSSENTWMIYDHKKIVGGHGKLFDRGVSHANKTLTTAEFNGRVWRTVFMQMEQRDYLFVGLDEEYIKKQEQEFRDKLYYGYAFFLIFAVFISFRGAKVLSQRIGLLMQAMRKFGQEQWGTRIHLKGNDEIRLLGDNFNLMASRIEELLNDVQEQQRLKRLFELRVLEYQINPHFLYNTLDSIHWLSLDNHQPKISQMVNGLSKLFRIILSKGKEMIPLAEEFEMAEIYLRIQKIRFEDRFDYEMELDPAVARYPISKLVLQPIVENAIVHGIRKLRTKGLIRISGKREGNEVVLEINDNGVGMTGEQIRRQIELLNSDVLEEGIISSTGYGLKNVDSRLKLVFGDDYRMDLRSRAGEDHGTFIRIRIKEESMRRGQGNMEKKHDCRSAV